VCEELHASSSIKLDIASQPTADSDSQSLSPIMTRDSLLPPPPLSLFIRIRIKNTTRYHTPWTLTWKCYHCCLNSYRRYLSVTVIVLIIVVFFVVYATHVFWSLNVYVLFHFVRLECMTLLTGIGACVVYYKSSFEIPLSSHLVNILQPTTHQCIYNSSWIARVRLFAVRSKVEYQFVSRVCFFIPLYL